MTIKFFPVFWIREVELSPMAVQGMAAAVPFLLALSSYAMHPLAMCVGAHLYTRVSSEAHATFVGLSLSAHGSNDYHMLRQCPTQCHLIDISMETLYTCSVRLAVILDPTPCLLQGACMRYRL